MNTGVYRIFPSSIQAPVQVRSTGHYHISPGWHDRLEQKSILELFWCISGIGEFDNGHGKKWKLKTNEVCFMFPGDWHNIHAVEKFNYWWVTFDGPWLSFLINSFNISRHPRYVGPCPEKLFLDLSSHLCDISNNGEYEASATAYRFLLTSMSPSHSKEYPSIQHFKDLIAQHYSEHSLSIQEISNILKVHRSTLVRLLQNQSNCSPKEYLTSYRLQIALKLLMQQRFTLKEISDATGFYDQNYFCKVFKKYFGLPPSQYSKQLSVNMDTESLADSTHHEEKSSQKLNTAS